MIKPKPHYMGTRSADIRTAPGKNSNLWARVSQPQQSDDVTDSLGLKANHIFQGLRIFYMFLKTYKLKKELQNASIRNGDRNSLIDFEGEGVLWLLGQL